MVEDIGKSNPFPGQGGASRKLFLVALEVSEKNQGPFTGIKSCCHKCDSAIMWVDRRVHVDVGIR